jgi:hypothetical protein
MRRSDLRKMTSGGPMAGISEEEKLRRRQITENVIGTNAMEGIVFDAETLALMRRYEEGELTRQELSAEIDLHVDKLLAVFA